MKRFQKDFQSAISATDSARMATQYTDYFNNVTIRPDDKCYAFNPVVTSLISCENFRQRLNTFEQVRLDGVKLTMNISSYGDYFGSQIQAKSLIVHCGFSRITTSSKSVLRTPGQVSAFSASKSVMLNPDFNNSINIEVYPNNLLEKSTYMDVESLAGIAQTTVGQDDTAPKLPDYVDKFKDYMYQTISTWFPTFFIGFDPSLKEVIKNLSFNVTMVMLWSFRGPNLQYNTLGNAPAFSKVLITGVSNYNVQAKFGEFIKSPIGGFDVPSNTTLIEIAKDPNSVFYLVHIFITVQSNTHVQTKYYSTGTSKYIALQNGSTVEFQLLFNNNDICWVDWGRNYGSNTEDEYKFNQNIFQFETW